MDIAVGVIDLIALTIKVAKYVDKVKSGPKDREKLVRKAEAIANVLQFLEKGLENCEEFVIDQFLNDRNGPLAQAKESLVRLSSLLLGYDVEHDKKLGKLASKWHSLNWPSEKGTAAEILDAIDQTQGTVTAVLVSFNL
jgi:hypothetical protein